MLLPSTAFPEPEGRETLEKVAFVLLKVEDEMKLVLPSEAVFPETCAIFPEMVREAPSVPVTVPPSTELLLVVFNVRLQSVYIDSESPLSTGIRSNG